MSSSRQKISNSTSTSDRNQAKYTFMFRYMKIIAILAQFPSLLQILKTLKTQSSGDISVPGLGVALFCSLSWLFYAIRLKDQPLIMSYLLCSLLTVINLIVTIIFL